MMQGLPDVLEDRRGEIGRSGDLSALQYRLKHLAAPLLGGDLYFPSHKALLSSDGGVCEEDGTRLIFDPLSPHRHTCPRCSREHVGKRHHRAWVWRYNIWLSERAIHLALLGVLACDRDMCGRSAEILEGYSLRYRDYPNADNVLGPTRLFFSTYLESIWLTQLVIAGLLLRADGYVTRKSIPNFEPMVRESAGLISQFDEGWSNRQVWNNTALIAAGLWIAGWSDTDSAKLRGPTGRTFHKLLAHGLDGPHGICAQLVSAVTDEGMWFEGENYHFFALRGFLLAAELLRWVGVDIYGDDGPRDRLRDMYVGPMRTVLPNLTLPARGDSPYGVSLVQPRFAELWEVGRTRTADTRVQSLLRDLYDAEAPDAEDPGFSEIAEQEQNRPAQSLSRNLLGWKSLLLMDPDEPRAGGRTWRVASTLLPQAGVAVLRNGPDRYVSVECGGRAGGHGHPDLLHLTLFAGQPILMDFGTASYVTPSLFWYRSSLAHNAPSMTGEDQHTRRGWCAAIDQKGRWGWCRAVAEDLFGPDTSAIRTIVVGPNSVLDIVDVNCPLHTDVELPLHFLDPRWVSVGSWSNLPGTSAAVDETLGDVLDLKVSGNLHLDGAIHNALLYERESDRLLVAKRAGPPDDQFADGKPIAFLVRRARGPGRWVQCYGTRMVRLRGLQADKDSFVVTYDAGKSEKVTLKEGRCRVIDSDGEIHKLGGARQRPEWPPPPRIRQKTIFCPVLSKIPSPSDWESALPKSAVVRLGAANYRRSELPYGAGRKFSARTAVFAVGDKLCFAVRVVKKNVTFRTADTPDPRFDNENADIHSDGVQCYLNAGSGGGEVGWRGYLLVPKPDSESVRVSAVAGTTADPSEAHALWERTSEGYSLLVAIDLGARVERGMMIPVDVVVNEMYSNRQRRAGQLALSGGGWVYLRGDREHPASATIAEVY